MRILGIDPGNAIMGYGILDYSGNRLTPVDYGCLRSSAGVPQHLRLHKLYNELNSKLRKYKPDCLAVEELFFNRNTKTALVVGQARGIVLLAAAEAGIEVYEYTPLQVKLAAVGRGRAEKGQVQYMVKIILNLPEIPRPDDVADALAVAICHANNGSGWGVLT
ncbi:MAG: Holliday junction resolvase [Peptococcaceae bacterium BRH_c8a]|nr:MAG: Holliday junction resolvase [Peptococcaceae bacterium BRH_c8a]